MVNDPRIRAGIFAGESGGDYDALYGYRNRDPNSQFGGTRVSEMSVGDVIKFTMPNSPYAQSVKNEIGRVATPVGAYQIVGTTLRNAVNSLGMDPNTPFNQETQDKLGQWVLDQQGVGAWEGYRGPQTGDGLKNFAGDMQVRSADAENRLQEKEREAGNYERTAVEMLMPHLASGNTGGQELGFGGGAGGGPLDSSAFGFPLGQEAPPGAAPVAPPPTASASSQSPTSITPDLIGADMGAAPPVNAEKELEADRAQRQQRVGEMLMLLSTGLGQMGAGQPVNLAPTLQAFQQMRAEQAELLRAEQEQEYQRQVAAQERVQQQFKNDLELRKVRATETRVGLETAKLQSELAGSQPLPPEMLDSLVREYPELEGTLALANNFAAMGNTDAYNRTIDRVIDHVGSIDNSSVVPYSEMAKLIDAPDEERPYHLANIASQYGPDAADKVNDLFTNGKADETRALTDQLMEADRSLPSAQREFVIRDPETNEIVQENRAAATQAALFRDRTNIEVNNDRSSELRFQDQQLLLEEARGAVTKLKTDGAKAASVLPNLQNATNAVIETGPLTGDAFRNAISSISRFAANVGTENLGATTAAMLTSVTNPLYKDQIDPDAFLTLNREGAQFLFMLADQLGMTGQGFTDADLKIFQGFASSGMLNDPAGRERLLAQYSASNLVRRASGELAREIAPDADLGTLAATADEALFMVDAEARLTEFFQGQIHARYNSDSGRLVDKEISDARSFIIDGGKDGFDERLAELAETEFKGDENAAMDYLRAGLAKAVPTLTERQAQVIMPFLNSRLPPGAERVTHYLQLGSDGRTRLVQWGDAK